MEVTMKNSTKQQIMDAYLDAKKKLDELNALKESSLTIAAKEKKANDAVLAENLIKKGILAESFIAEYNALCSTMECMKEEIKNLHGINAEIDSFIAMVNAHKVAEKECKDRYDALEKECEEKYLISKKEKEAEIESLKIQKEEILASTKAEHNKLMADLNTQRLRDREEYEYNVKRSRQIENDDWNDEVSRREKELAKREEDIQAQTDEVNKKADYIVELENKVEDLVKKVDEAYANGKKDGKAEADKSNAFEVRALKTEHTYAIKALESDVARLKDIVEENKYTINNLQEKLDLSYVQMKELAAETVKSSGGVKILNGDNSSK